MSKRCQDDCISAAFLATRKAVLDTGMPYLEFYSRTYLWLGLHLCRKDVKLQTLITAMDRPATAKWLDKKNVFAAASMVEAEIVLSSMQTFSKAKEGANADAIYKVLRTSKKYMKYLRRRL